MAALTILASFTEQQKPPTVNKQRIPYFHFRALFNRVSTSWRKVPLSAVSLYTVHNFAQRVSSLAFLMVASPWYRVVRCVSKEDKPYSEQSLRRTGLRACGISSSLKIASLNLFKIVH